MSIPPRWRLLDVITETTLTDCIDIDGLFVDRVFPVPPLYERYTLVDCVPSGPLLAAIDGTGPAWFGSLVLEGAHLSGRQHYETLEELLDVRVVSHRVAAEGSGRLHIDLEGHRREGDNNDGGTVAPAVSGYRLLVYENKPTPIGECRDIVGLFHERPEIWPPGPSLTLLGCRPGLTGSVDVELAHVHVDGTAHTMGQGKRFSGRVVTTRPSELGDNLVDLTLDARIPEPMAATERPLWDMWHDGGPAELNSWAKLDRSGRYLWVRAAAVHHIYAPDKPTGTVYNLDGRYITDYDAFYCAIGEAINGPGGWFGGDLLWLHENAATGDGGATPGFRLIWHDSEMARAHLVPGYDRKSWLPAVTFDDLVRRLTEDGVRLELR